MFYLGTCNHRDMCAKCGIRQRHFFKTNSCVMCKQELKDVIITREAAAPFSAFDLKKLIFDGTWGVHFDGQSVADEMLKLRSWDCPECKVNQGGLAKLKRHIRHEHQKLIWYVLLSFPRAAD